jgi:hypothetical protein
VSPAITLLIEAAWKKAGLEDLVGYPAEGDRADVRDTMLSGEGVQRLCAGGGRKGGGEGGRQNQAATHAAL